MGLLEKAFTKARHVRHHYVTGVREPAKRERLSRVIATGLPAPKPLEPAAAPLVASLREDGFARLDGIFDVEKLHALRQAIDKKPCTDGWRPQLGQFALENAPAESTSVHVVGLEDTPGLLEIANHPVILSAVGQYLGCRPTIDDVLVWWSLPGRPAFEEQFWHRDNDSVRFLKLFIYLSDVDEEAGPHRFVRGSHRSNILIEREKRFTDEDVLGATPADSIESFTGPFGTAFLEDTYGLHKGTAPTGKLRLLLQVRYTMLRSIFAEKKRMGALGEHDRYSNRLIAFS